MELRPKTVPKTFAKRIDQNDLDNELAQQSETYNQVARAHALAVSRRDKAKERVAVVKAECYFDVVADLERLGIKISETAIAIHTERNVDYREAVRAYQAARLEADQLEADKDAWAQRAFALKDLAALWLGGYYADSSVRGEAPQAVQDANYQRNRQALARERMRRVVDE